MCLVTIKTDANDTTVVVIKLSAWQAGVDVSWLSPYQSTHTAAQLLSCLDADTSSHPLMHVAEIKDKIDPV